MLQTLRGTCELAADGQDGHIIVPKVFVQSCSEPAGIA